MPRLMLAVSRRTPAAAPPPRSLLHCIMLPLLLSLAVTCAGAQDTAAYDFEYFVSQVGISTTLKNAWGSQLYQQELCDEFLGYQPAAGAGRISGDLADGKVGSSGDGGGGSRDHSGLDLDPYGRPFAGYKVGLVLLRPCLLPRRDAPPRLPFTAPTLAVQRSLSRPDRLRLQHAACFAHAGRQQHASRDRRSGPFRRQLARQLHVYWHRASWHAGLRFRGHLLLLDLDHAL